IIAVVEHARRQNAPTIAITNSENSQLARAADDVILQHAGDEKSIAATKTYTTQLAALALLSALIAPDAAREKELDGIVAAVAQSLALENICAEYAARWKEKQIALIIGRGYNYATAFEIALKLKELAYVAAEPYSSADFLHGPIALATNEMPVIVIAPRGSAQNDLHDAAQQLRARGADVLEISEDADAKIKLPVALPEWLSPFTAIIPGQLLALHLAAAKGYDPDQPRGLTKITRTL
ncbi:MAG: SIS domain-containing protein, partial [Chloroflexi bacterium]|nr:SIS domain-containing protein [Chloroflexota bacterium]